MKILPTRLKSSSVAVAIFLWSIALIMSGCTHNDGDIGPWFGTWSLREVTYKGAPDKDYKHNVFWSFQSEVVRMEVNKSLGNYAEHFGSWEELGDKLVLRFIYTDDSHSSWEGIFDFPSGIGFPKSGTVTLEIVRMKGSDLTLKYINSERVTVGYTLKKIY